LFGFSRTSDIFEGNFGFDVVPGPLPDRRL
jgi:hypothetical protein